MEIHIVAGKGLLDIHRKAKQTTRVCVGLDFEGDKSLLSKP